MLAALRTFALAYTLELPYLSDHLAEVACADTPKKGDRCAKTTDRSNSDDLSPRVAVRKRGLGAD